MSDLIHAVPLYPCVRVPGKVKKGFTIEQALKASRGIDLLFL